MLLSTQFLSVCCALVMLFASPAVAHAERKTTEDIRHLSERDVLRLALNHPAPRYPTGARAAGLKGTGLFRIDFNAAGDVTNVLVLKSTGHRRLDLEAIKTLRSWRIRAHTGYEGLIIPVIFTF